MSSKEFPRLRTLAVAGHGTSGKTTLVSALLYQAGAETRLGRIEEGNTVTDYDEDEIERGISLGAALASCRWNEVHLNLVDTPGYGNFITEASLAMPIADTALVSVCGVDGVQVNTERVWGFAESAGAAAMLVVNRLDRERSSFTRALAGIRRAFGRTAIPVQLPIGEEAEFRGVLDLISMKAHLGPGPDGRTASLSETPGEMQAAAETARSELMEMIAESDEELLEHFFEAGELSEEQMLRGLAAGVASRSIFPVFAAAAARNIGTTALLDAITAVAPAPAERGPAKGRGPDGEPAEREVSASAPASVYVFKTIADPFAGRLSLFRVMTGSVSTDTPLRNLRTGGAERLGSVYRMNGKATDAVASLGAGDLGCFAKLRDTATGDTLAVDDAVRYLRPEVPRPVISFAIEPKSRGDEEKISQALQRLGEEDLTLTFERDRELRLSGTGQLHIEVVVSRLKRKYGVEVSLKPPRVPYRETITASAEAHGRHKKQTGGHGQFADCHVRVEPLPRGADFVFESKIVGGVIPRQFIPAIEKGFQEARQKGYVAGYPVVDFKATVFDGKFHAVDSSEIAFKIAASLAFRDAMSRCRPTLLEPVMAVEITVPEETTGDVLGDLNARRGRTQGMDTRGDAIAITAQVPMAEMLTYEPTLTSLTGGRGGFRMEFSHYDPVPPNIAKQLIDAHNADSE